PGPGTGGKPGSSGGLAGSNQGRIEKSFATGAVTGSGSNANGGLSTVGGLAGINQGSISDSFATGNVGSDVTGLTAGGLIGDNIGRVERSFPTGNGVTGNKGTAGGPVGMKIGCPDGKHSATGSDRAATHVHSSPSRTTT